MDFAKIPAWLRWILFVPAAFIASLGVILIANLLSIFGLHDGYPLPTIRYIGVTNMGSAMAFLWVGSQVAPPRNKFYISIFLSILVVLGFMLFFLSGRVPWTWWHMSWLDLITGVISTLSACTCAIVQSFSDMNEPKRLREYKAKLQGSITFSKSINPPRHCMVEHFDAHSRCITVKPGFAMNENEKYIWIKIDGGRLEKEDRQHIWFVNNPEGKQPCDMQLQRAVDLPVPEGHWSLSFQKKTTELLAETKLSSDETTKQEIKRLADKTPDPEKSAKILERLSELAYKQGRLQGRLKAIKKWLHEFDE